MSSFVLNAHFDGQQIRLDEPYDLPINARLVVTILPRPEEDAAWAQFSLRNLARAYGDDEPEYPASLVKQPNRP